MVNLLSIIGLGLVSTAICIIIKQNSPEYSLAISIACSIAIFYVVISSLQPVIDSMNNLMTNAKISNEYTSAVIKALGICYITELASDCCKDAGQTAIATKIELGGKVMIVLLSLPLFDNLVEIVKNLMY